MPAPPWWRETCVYQIYPRSFADANGDGIGDLRGILGKLDYLQSLGVETVWLSPFFASPQADFGYDISDHMAIDPAYGTLEDCRALIGGLHARGMKIVFDLVLNHTSDKHPWFLESLQGRGSPKRDWYLWREGRRSGGRAPPNNWRSMLGGSGWHYHRASGDWYYASFLPFQPDLNYRNPQVADAMLGVVRHWLSEGVDGLRLDVFNALFKDASFADNPFSWRPIPSETNPHGYFQKTIHNLDHPDTLAFARRLRAVIDEYSPPRFLVGEVFGDAASLRRYCGDAADGLNLVFLFQTLRTRLSAAPLRKMIRELELAFPEPFSPTYVLGNHDRPRSSLRFARAAEKLKLLAALQLTVRGVPFIYYGEELGMENHELPLHEGLDPVAARFRFVPQRLASFLRGHGILMNRDECRTPMQWSAAPNAGFTTERARPWLPLHPNHRLVNVESEQRDPTSIWRCYQALLELRRRLPALTRGALEWPESPPELVCYRRRLDISEPGSVDIWLNPSPRARPLEGRPGRSQVFSSRLVATLPARELQRIEPNEGLVFFDPPARE